MKTIVFAHNKGGVGKSTLSVNIAYALQKRGYKTALKDMDSQGTTFACISQRDNISVYIQGDSIPVEQLDFLITDTPPYLSSDYITLFGGADMVIIPSRPNPADVIEIAKTSSVVKQVQYKNPNLKGLVLFNDNDQRTNMIHLVREKTEESGLPIFDTVINHRVAYARSLLMPEGVFTQYEKGTEEFDKTEEAQNQTARDEINNLVNEILTILQ